ncbi:hypothetical protein JYT85_01405 [Desulfocapsa sp. AH-315-G09]|uniref:Uncharacterized protein n=1 Tax=Desulfotalea psychrophila TaxID=84980 RepID=A0ABS3AUT3_9BACT|nr:hypothetical protein [Desulfocapsa sp.]MBN4065284.1 hypothetical protein [Desulfocapsa sp. AH-315-G09]MBN4068863.1 hypothetical protein [Desulfotalea psychrophila]
MKRILLTVFLVLGFFCSSVVAAETDIHIEWAYNGNGDLAELGFRLYQKSLDESVRLVATFEGIDTRDGNSIIPVEPGRSFYALCAYNADRDGALSDWYPFEYIAAITPGMPAPTIIIKFN